MRKPAQDWERVSAGAGPASAAQAIVEGEAVPRLRGLLHVYALWASLAAGAVLLVLAPAGRARMAAIIYAVGLCALFAASALHHRWWGSPRRRPLLRRLDHSTIFVFIAASFTPVGLLALRPPLGTAVLVGVWAGAAAGVALSLAWISAPRWLVAGSCLALGWVMVIALPDLFRQVGAAASLLFLAGGGLYSLGAAVYASERPNPWPRTFGFHEVFHALVIAAAVVHFIAIAGWVIPNRLPP
jgi:hemolysin III